MRSFSIALSLLAARDRDHRIDVCENKMWRGIRVFFATGGCQKA